MSGLFCAVLLSAVQAVDVTFGADRPDCIYACGEEATLTVAAKEKNGALSTNGFLQIALDNFGETTGTNFTADLAKANPIIVKGTMKTPGFLRVQAGGKSFSCGFEPTKIKRGGPRPNDFDAFWESAIKKLDKTVPLDPIVTPMPERTTKDYTVSRVSFATSNGRRVYGYLSVPNDRTKAPYPVRVQVPGAGCGAWSNYPQVSADAICLFMSVFPFEPNPDLTKVQPKAKALEAELDAKYGTKRYCRAGLGVSREEYFYYPVILGINRAVNWLAERPDIDKKSFTYSGVSQGGGFGFYLLGLNKNFTKGCLFVPALTDLLGSKDQNRLSGWPCLLEHAPDNQKAATEKNAPYFDGANFASRIHIPVRVVVGFSDTTCPPPAVYSGYNELSSKDKKILHGINMGHGVFGHFCQELGAWENR